MMKQHIFKILLMALLAVGSGAAEKALGADLRVPGQFSSVQKALDAATPGDRVQVAEGVYFEHVTLKKEVTLEGGWSRDFSRRDPAKFATVLDGIKEKGPVVTGADQAVLDGFTIIHGSLLVAKDDSSGSGIYCQNVSVTIINNTIRENQPSGMFLSGGFAVITENMIYDNAQAGIYGRKGVELRIHNNEIYGNKYSGISIGKLPASKIEVRNNVIYNNDRSAINCLLATGDIENNIIYHNSRAGIICSLIPLRIINNTVVGNGQAGVWVKDPAAVATIKNNIFTHNIDAGIRTSGKGFSHNLFFANGQTGECNPEYLWCVKPQYGGYGDEKSYKKNHGIIADPLFVDAAGHDYHLRPGSPAIDAGDKDGKFNDVNFPPSLGTKKNDLGAYGGPYAIAEKRGKNHPPVADAGPDQTVRPGKRVILDGSNSSDPDGDSLIYEWKLVSLPKASQAKILKADRVKTICKIDKPGVYEAQLVVTDKLGLAGKPAVVKITVTGANRIPRASIGEVLSQVSAGDAITLYGSASKDPDGDPLTYKWSLLFRPAASKAVITEPTSVNSSFHVDVDGGYTIQLVVNDGKADSKPAIVNISTINSPHEGTRNVPEDYPTIQAAIDAAQAEEWREALKQRVLSGAIDPTQPLPTDADHPYTPLTDKCQKAMGKALAGIFGGTNIDAMVAQAEQAYADYQACLEAEFDGWFDTNFPPEKLDDLIDGDRTAMSTADNKLADLLYDFRYAQAPVPGGHEQTGPTCTLNSLAMLFDEKNGRHGTEDQASIVQHMSETTSKVWWIFNADCWSGGNPGSWGGRASWQDCVNNMLSDMGADYTVHDDWDDIISTVEGGTPVLVTYFIKGWTGCAFRQTGSTVGFPR